MKILDYKVLMADDIEEQVMWLINKGYEPLGGVAIRHGSMQGHAFVQAMIMYFENMHLDIDTDLEFGKYQGETVEDILDNDIDYIKWLVDQGVSVSDEVMEIIERQQ